MIGGVVDGKKKKGDGALPGDIAFLKKTNLDHNIERRVCMPFHLYVSTHEPTRKIKSRKEQMIQIVHRFLLIGTKLANYLEQNMKL